MRATILALLLLASVCTAASAGPPYVGYVGLYVDSAHNSWCIPNPNPLAHYTVWSWCRPSSAGASAACFAVIGGTIYRGPEQVNPSVVYHYSGTNFMTGLIFYYWGCQYDWHWIHKEDISDYHAGPRGTKLWIEMGVLDHGQQLRTCEEGSPWRQFVILTNAYFGGTCGPIGTENVTWGTIKNLYAD